MKRYFLNFLALLFCFCTLFCGCSKDDGGEEKEENALENTIWIGSDRYGSTVVVAFQKTTFLWDVTNLMTGQKTSLFGTYTCESQSAILVCQYVEGDKVKNATINSNTLIIDNIVLIKNVTQNNSSQTDSNL